MKSVPTHQATFGTHRDVVAWQFHLGIDVPDWVRKTIKDYPIKEGDWVIVDPEERMSSILHDNEFQTMFRPI